MIQENQWIAGTKGPESFEYYNIEVNDVSLELVIKVKPQDIASDPDLYITNSAELPTQSKKNSGSYTWKSTCFGKDTIALRPGSFFYIPGIYTIGVFSIKACNYQLKYSKKVFPKCLLNDLTVAVEKVEYFILNIKYPGSSRLELTVLGGKSAVFLSFKRPRPNEKHHDYSINNYSIEPSNLIDPLASLPLSFVQKNFNEFLRAGTDTGRLCIETSSVLPGITQIYVSIVNLDPYPNNFSIIFREILESDLIPQEKYLAYQFYNEKFRPFNPNEALKADRDEFFLNYNSEFTYGEVEFLSICELVKYADPRPNEVFWDLGCGAGRCLVAVALSYNFLTVKGVEFLPNLYKLSCEVTKGINNIQVTRGDIKDTDWKDADIVYISSVCFLDELINAIHLLSCLLKPGSRLFTLKKFLEPEPWVLVKTFIVRMSWGYCDCYFYVKH